jgi:PHD/YefM family antitoxin component YafN of YafNO toxin-antitoxin module
MTVTEISISDARAQLGDLTRRAAHSRERIALTDHGHVSAIIVSPQDLADLEDALAVAEYRAEQAVGTVSRIPADEARRRLGL